MTISLRHMSLDVFSSLTSLYNKCTLITDTNVCDASSEIEISGIKNLLNVND